MISTRPIGPLLPAPLNQIPQPWNLCNNNSKATCMVQLSMDNHCFFLGLKIFSC